MGKYISNRGSVMLRGGKNLSAWNQWGGERGMGEVRGVGENHDIVSRQPDFSQLMKKL